MKAKSITIAFLLLWTVGTLKVHAAQDGIPATSAVLSPQEQLWLVSGKNLYIIDPQGKGEQKLEVGSNADHFVISPDGKLAALACYGEIDVKFNWSGKTELWPKKDSKSSLVIIELSTGKILANHLVPFQPIFTQFSPDGSSIIVCSKGQVSKNLKKHISPVMTVMEPVTGKVLQRFEMDSEPSDMWYSRSTNKIILPCSIFPGRTQPGPEIVVLNPITGETTREKLPSAPISFQDTGNEALKLLRLVTGAVYVDSNGKMIGTPFQPGKDNVHLIKDPTRWRNFILGKTGKQGALFVVENGKEIANLKTAPIDSIVFGQETRKIFVCGGKECVVLDSETLKESSRFAIPGSLREAILNPKEDRLYFLSMDDQVSVYDIQQGKKIAGFTSGREGKKFLSAMAVASANALGSMQYAMTGVPGQYFTIPNAVQTVAFSPNSNYMFIFNDQTNDITAVHTTNHTILSKTATGSTTGQFLWKTKDGKHLISCGVHKLLIYDMDSGKLTTEREFQKPCQGLTYQADIEAVFVRNPSETDVLHPVTLEKKHQLKPGKEPFFIKDTNMIIIVDSLGATIYTPDMKQFYSLNGVAEFSNVWILPRHAQIK